MKQSQNPGRSEQDSSGRRLFGYHRPDLYAIVTYGILLVLVAVAVEHLRRIASSVQAERPAVNIVFQENGGSGEDIQGPGRGSSGHDK